MAIKIIDDSKVKIKNKEHDKQVTEAIKQLDDKKIDHVNIIRSIKGEIMLLEIHHKKIKNKEVSKWQNL